MASDTVPASPGLPEPPAHPPANGIPQPARQGGGWLGGALAAVDPARPTFNLNPTTDGAGDDTATLTQGGSSADFHTDGDQTTSDGTTSSGSTDKSVLRAFAHAAIERWRKGADARNKALDIQKEKAKALQVKEARTTNRSEKIVGGNTSTGATNNASKGSDTKTSAVKKDHASGGKSNGSSVGGGRSGAGGRSGPAGSGGAGTKTNHGSKTGNHSGGTDKAAHRSGPGIRSAARDRVADRVRNGPKPKDTKDPKPQTENRSTGPVRSAVQDRVADRIRNGPRDKAAPKGDGKGSTSHTHSGAGKTPTPKTSTSTCGTGSGIDMTKPKKDPADKTTQSGTPKAGSGGAGGAGGTNTGTGKDPKTPTTGGGTKPADLTKKNPDTKGGPTKLDPKTPTGKPDPTKTTPSPSRTTVDTKASREAGYRDGTRIGKVKAHVGAYTDGVKDGKADMQEAAARDKARLDQARQQRRQPPPAPIPPKPTVPPKPSVPPAPDPRTILHKPKETPVAPASSTAAPIKVDRIDDKNLHLGDGAARTTIGRGEVRRLKDFERQFTVKADTMTRIGDAAKMFAANDAERTKAITYLMEQARAVDGGEDLIADLTRLQEAATVREAKAAELHRQAVRGADNTRTLLANVETRYGGMYQAVVDSPRTKPAESAYYRK
ncbi:MAG: hypothetical protein HOY79_04765 [Streptomyces sp.]|nr:hypothetical protein [Streptomyces sp.]NUS15396.1 hypothetical protein [Streptomyces sp.]NUS24023.1 hypothetical protein [Streptomyces sp.]